VASTSAVTPSGREMPSNEIIDRAGEQSAPVDMNPGLNLDSAGDPADTSK
jgi:hypothetical protein